MNVNVIGQEVQEELLKGNHTHKLERFTNTEKYEV